MAAIGIEQLKRVEELCEKRKAIARRYDLELANNSKVMPLCHDYDEVVPHVYVVKLAKNLNREKLRQKLNNLGIQTGVHYQPNHRLTFYAGAMPPLPQVDSIYPWILSLPMHPELSEADTIHVARTLLDSVDNA